MGSIAAHEFQGPEALEHARGLQEHPPISSTSSAASALVAPPSAPIKVALDEVKSIKECHEMGQTLGITLWNTPYEAALDPENERFKMYNQLDLLDDGTLILTEIKPGKKFTRTLQIDPEKIKLEKSKVVPAIREHIKQSGFEWDKKPEGYLRADVSIDEYRTLTQNYDATTDKEKVEALMDPEGSKRGGAVFAFDREVTLHPDDPQIIFRLRGKHTAPAEEAGAYGIDDILEVIRK
ncbi:hypothetical protein KA057_03550 [Candidatus Gracilibacteria bacterium]|nr:hypothetical protein [Candidatus Gracilibacteria bacterium]